MKDRIVLDLKGNKARQEIVKIQEYTRNNNFDCIVFKKINQVPETFEELKELCRNSKIQKCSFASDFIVKTREPLTCYEHICIDGIYFVENGEIYAGYESDCIRSNRTPAQMWNIIKNLIGEE